MYPTKKQLRFVKIVVFLRAVTSEILHEISPFALFLVKKNNYKKTNTLQTNRSVLCKLSSYYKGFSLKLSEISPIALLI